MKKRRVVDVVRDIIGPQCISAGLELVDVEFVKEGPFRYLRVIIDKEDGVSLDDCSAISKFLNTKLDEVDPIEENYFLEVTSPGVERELKKTEDFARFAGEMVILKLFTPVDGQKVLKGILVGLEGQMIIITVGNQKMEVPKEKVTSVKLVVDFDHEEDN